MLALLVLGTWGVALAPNPARAAGPINACGTISSNTVWTAGNVYVINNCSTVVATGVTLTVQPGTVVKFAGARDVLFVQGTLMAQGTAGAPIAFTSLRDDSHGGDTNGDGASSGHAGEWAGVRFASGSHGRLAYAFIGYGGSGAYDYVSQYNLGMVESYSSDVTFNHVTLQASGYNGLYCDNASVQVAYGQVNNNAAYGLYWNGVDASVPLVVSDTTFSGNGTAAGWLHFRDAAGTVTFERNTATEPRNGFRADGQLNQGSLTWNNGDDLPLLISGGLTIAPATTLALEPGSVVKFGDPRDVLLVQGTLDALGTAGSPIALTSVSDDAHGGDTNGDGSSQGQPGQWAGLRFAAGSTGRLGYAFIGYGGSGAYDYVSQYNVGMVESYSSDVTFNHVTLQASGYNGLYCDNASVQVAYGQVNNNAAYGLYWNGVDASVPLVVSDTTFSGNGTAAGWLHFRDAAGTVTFERNTATEPRNGFRADGRLNQGSLTWDNGDDLPLLISGGLTIAPATTLALEPGSVVKFGDGRDVLLVQGTLDALGTAGSPIALTSVSDDAHGGDTDGYGPSQGQPGQWAGLRFAVGSSGRLAYAFIGYGGSRAYDYVSQYNLGMVESFSSDVTFDHCTLYASGWDGLYAENATVAFTNGTVSDNARYGLNYNGLDAAVPLVVTGNVFSGSQGSAARLDLRGNPPQITFQGNSGSGSQRRGFSLAGTITSNAVWDNTGSLPLVIDGGLTVASGATLTVQPGTVVKFAGPRDVLFVQGALVAIGTEAAPIAFTSLGDDAHGGDTNGDGSSQGQPGQWAGLRFAAGSAGRMAYAFIGYGGSGTYDYVSQYNVGMVESYSSDVTLDHVTLQASAWQGLYAGNASVAATNSQFADNGNNGLYYEGIDPVTPLVVQANTFSGNATYGAWVHITETAGQITVAHNQSVAPKNGLRVSGGLTQGTMGWDNPNAPMVIDGGLAIRAGATLTLEPGAVVKFAGGRDVLEVAGTLAAEGTFAAPIAFTSISDDAHGGDTNGDGPSTGSRGQWGGLRFLSGSNATLRHSFIGYGGSGAYDYLQVYGRGLVDIRGGSVDIKYGALRSSALQGLYTENADVQVAYAAITDHAQSGIYNGTPSVGVNARYNWWGDPSGPQHPTLNPSGTGSTVSNGVAFVPWLDRFTWLDPTTMFLHGVAALSWTAFDIDPASLTSDVEATGPVGTQSLGRGFPAGGELEWDTRPLPNGRYELRASWRDLTGTPVSEAVRSVIVNNDPTIVWHGGRLTTNETWVAGFVHVVEEDVIVGTGVHLTIEPGTVVKFAPGTRIIVEDGGIVDAPATEAAPIIFTSITDDVSGDTNLDGSQSLPRPGDWNGIVTRGTGQFNDNPFVDVRYTQTEHSGVLSGDERWLGSFVHHVTSDDTDPNGVTVPSGVTLTIEAGAIVKFDAYKGLTVQPGGHLVALGSVAEPIVFTSIRDDTAGGDTNGDSDATTPQPGDWRWIYVDTTDATFDHVEMRYGGGNSSGSWNQTGMIRTTGAASLTVTNSILRDAFFDGILAWGGTANVRSSIFTNIDRAICAHPGSLVHVVNCAVDGNRIGLLVHGGTMDVTNTISSNNHDSGIQYDFGTLTSVRYSDVWAPSGSTSVNYVGTSDQTGSNGNISRDPHYVDRDHRDYRLDYRSPAIDAADGPAAPATDIIGSPRYDDPRTPNTGIATAGGAYADMGAYEFVETASSNLDLIVSSISGPTAVLAGDTVRVQWTITNIGSGEVVGPWHDTVNLVLSPDANPTVIFAAEVLVGEGERLGPGQSLSTSAEIRAPGSVVGTHYWQVVTNTRGEVFEGRNRENNTGVSLAPVAVDLPELVVGGPALSRQFDAAGEAHWFKFIPSAGQDVIVRLDRAGTGGVTELYIGQGYMPSRERFDARQNELNAPDVSTLAASTSTQTYYVLAYPASLPGGAATFTISARALDFSLDAVGPQQVGNAGTVTLALHGGQLRSDMTFEIVDALGGVHGAESVFISNSSLAYVTFDLTGLPLGTYSVRVRDGARTATLTNGINIIAGTPGSVQAHLTMPSAMRPDWTGLVTVDYANVGDTDVVAPLMVLSVQNAKLQLPGKTEFAYPTVQLLGINAEGPAGILPPGGHGTITLQMQPTASGGTIYGKLWVLSNPSQPWDWNAAKSLMRPSFVPADAWEQIFTNFTADVGTTVGQYQSVLAYNATYLSQLGEYTPDVQRLLAFALNQAGLSSLSQRYAIGMFGRAGTTWWDSNIVNDPEGNVAIGAGGYWRFFRRQSDGSYRGVTGEVGEFTVGNDGYLLREPEGLSVAFGPDGMPDYVEDNNGNRVTAAYDGGRLTALRLANGDTVSLDYNADGRVAALTDPVGRISTFTYDAASEYLRSAQAPSGTLSFDYNQQTSGRARAVESIGFPDGTHLSFGYDSQGRFAGVQGDGGVEVASVSYDSAGGVTATDAAGAVETVLFDDQGQPARVSDGQATTLAVYDGGGLPVRLVGSDGAAYSFGFDESSRLVRIGEASGSSVGLTHDPTFNQLTDLSNARGYATHFERDARGNLVGITYPTGEREEFQYDEAGKVTAWVNGRQQTKHVSYDGQDLLVREDLADGSARTFTFDAHRNLIAATDAHGTTQLDYDTADRLTRIAYPAGRSLEFTYDAGGRRARSRDQDGFVVNYLYDSAGRLAGLTDGLNNKLVSYSYDVAGRLVGKDLGNGVSTTYEYDSSGRMLAVASRRADSSVISQFEYTYDRQGRRTAMHTIDGQWTYTYDLSGQLTQATFNSTNPAMPAEDLTFAYDEAGNRLRTIRNGVVTEWSANAADQYTSAGNGSFTYDADGNLTLRQEGAGQWIYEYDAESRLISVQGPDGSWSFEYDVFGNRRASTHDGERTEYLTDPASGDVVATYDATGAATARYAYGIGLVTRLDVTQGAMYYTFDALGNTSELTGANGGVLNRYAYLPSGEATTLAGAVADPFRFVGERGVMADGDRLYQMGARHFDANLGRFLQRDPIGVDGGFNLYTYAGNDPINGRDPTGLVLPQATQVKLLKEAIAHVYGNPKAVEAISRILLQNEGQIIGFINGLPKKMQVVEEFVRRAKALEDQAYAVERVARAARLGIGKTFKRGTMQVANQAVKQVVRTTVATTAEGAASATGTGTASVGLWGVLNTPVTAVGIGTTAVAVTAAAAVGVAIGTGLRYIPGVDEGAQSAWTKLNDWTGGWLFGTPPVAEAGTPIVTSHDPNDLIGPSGSGTAHWIAPDQTLPYTIRFENDKQATAPAQVVRITEQLDPDLDLTTFQLGNFSFDGVVVTVPAGRTFYSERLDLRATYGLYLDISANLDFDTGVVTWVFASVDPVTGTTPRDPLTGFLPPNVISPIGQGYVTYTIRPQSSSAIGTPISAEASIVFDTNDPIDTPQHLNPVGPIADCIGDCDNSGRVTVNELITMVNVALGNLQVLACVAGDLNTDGRITVNEIITAVNNALNGCPVVAVATPTPSRVASATPTPTPTPSPQR